MSRGFTSKPFQWMIQQGVFTEDDNLSTASLVHDLFPGDIIKEPQPYRDSLALDLDAPWFVRGSFALITALDTWSWRSRGSPLFEPTYWESFSFSALSRYFAEDVLLNAPTKMTCLPLSDAVSHIGTSSAFVRPDSGRKPFSGQVFASDSLAIEAQWLRQRGFDPGALMVYIGDPLPIAEEYRFVFVGRRLLSGSLYMLDSQIVPVGIPPEEAWLFASSFSEVIPHPDCVLDVARVDEGWRIVEINAIETSSFYGADRQAIYRELRSSRSL